MDVGNQNHWDLSAVVPSKEILELIKRHYPLKAIGGTESGETSLRFRFEDGEGEIGFISSVSQPFCRSCNRLRLSASGSFYTCLFATQGIDIKDALRSGASKQQVRDIILSLWSKRHDRYSELRSQLYPQHKELHKVEMFQIGG
jgi:cyclic pyranopterin phosphate synthase